MNSDINANADAPGPLVESIAHATSELNNLLQIISGTTSLIEHVCQDNESSVKQLAILRASIQRAEKLAAGLVKQAGGPNERMLTNTKLGDAAKKCISRSAGKKQSVLVVDDEQMTLGLMSRILTEGGYQVTTAQSGFECLDHFRRSPFEFHLVLLDLSMPFMDGEETFNRLREIRPDMPIVMCTGFIQQEKLQRLMASGLAGFLRKPLAPNEIVDHIRAILSSVKYSRARGDSNDVSAAV
jgi:CheY-like chemotaxis protein